MRITEIWIKQFGMLAGVKLSFKEGVNVVYGENETGKSSIMEFILAMFYGIGKGDERRRYEPWAGGKLDGVIEFEHDGKTYTLSRQFGHTKSADKISLWCIPTGEPISIPSHVEPGEHVFGINKETFINSVFIGQAGVPIRGDNNEILAKLTNLAASGDETASRSEISDRLKEASAALKSKRAGAVIPTLEKQRQDLVDERQRLSAQIEAADAVRDEVTKLTHRSQRFSTELADLESRNTMVEQLRQLKELDEVIRRRKATDEAQQKYEALHNTLFSDDSAIDRSFLQDSRDLMEQYNNQQGFIRAKQEQYENCCAEIDAIDRTPLSGMKLLKRYRNEIQDAFNQYRELRERRLELERELEENPPRKINPLNTQKALIIGGAVIILLVILGFINNIFFVFAGIVAVIVGGYFILQKTGIGLNLMPSGNIQLNNIDVDIHEINRQMRPILDELGVRDVEELDREVHRMESINTQIHNAENERDGMLEELAELRDQLSGIMETLKEKIAPYKQVDDDDQALMIISKLDSLQCEHAALEERFHSEQEGYEIALAGREYEDVETEAEMLREALGENVEYVNSDFNAYDDALAKCREELSATRESLASRQTELGMMDTDPSELSKLEEEIKLIDEKIAHYDLEYRALEEAMSSLDDAFESMQKDFGPMINFRAGKILAALTEGRYNSVVVSESLTPSVKEPGGTIQGCQTLSSGTVDQIYLSLRMAIAGILSEENLPLLFDDAFSQLDDGRMNKAMNYLIKESSEDRLGQILIFTCHERIVKAAVESGQKCSFIQIK